MTIGPKETAISQPPHQRNRFLAALLKRRRTHDFTASRCGQEYVFEPADLRGGTGYMTGQRRGVKKGHVIVLQHQAESVRYRVETIEYYSSPSDMWIALLMRED